MRPLMEEMVRERQSALLAEAAQTARVAAVQAPVRFRSRRALARGLHSLAEWIDVCTPGVRVNNA